VSASVAIVALLVGIAARKKELSCSLLSASNIVTIDPSGIDPGLKVQFRGEPIGTLTKLTFSLRNTGAAAIKIDDVKEPIRLRFPTQSKILTAALEGTGPQHFLFSVRLDPSSNAVNCEFPLLNSGDEAFFSVYVQSTGTIMPFFEGRIVDVPQMLYNDKSEVNRSPGPKIFTNHGVRTVVRWSLVVLYSALSALFIGVWIMEMVEHIRRSFWMRKYQDLFNRKVREAMREEAERRTKMRKLIRESGRESAAPDEARDLMPPKTYFEYKASQRLKKEGISDRPSVLFESWVGLLGGTVLFWGLFIISGLTALITFGALRG
jgi:hypothetical protein